MSARRRLGWPGSSGLGLALLLAGCAAAPTTAPPALTTSPSTGSPPTAAVAATGSPGAAAPRPAAAAPAPPPPTHLKVATQRLASDVALYVASARGYFAEQGLEVEFEDIVTGMGALPPLAAGQLDVGVGAVSSGLFNAIARGIDIRLVATKGAVGPDPQSLFVGPQGLVLAADVAASGTIQDYRDLRGRTIGLSERGAGLEAMLDRAIQPSGLTTQDVEFKLMPYPDMLVALANRSIEGAMELEPFIAQGAARGVLVRWKSGAELYPGQQAAAIVYGPTLRRMAGDAGQRLMVAYTRALRDYYDAFGPRQRGRAEIVTILTENTPLKDAALYDQMGATYFNPDCYLNADAMQWDLDWYTSNGFVTQKPNLLETIDNSYCDYAVQQLGRYQP